MFNIFLPHSSHVAQNSGEMDVEIRICVTLFSLTGVAECGNLTGFHLAFLESRVFYWMKHQE